MIRIYTEGELDPSEYEGVMLDVIASGNGFVCIDGMVKSDFELLQSTFSSQLDTNVIKSMTWIPLAGGEFQAVV
jgi:hypothetical protein